MCPQLHQVTFHKHCEGAYNRIQQSQTGEPQFPHHQACTPPHFRVFDRAKPVSSPMKSNYGCAPPLLDQESYTEHLAIELKKYALRKRLMMRHKIGHWFGIHPPTTKLFFSRKRAPGSQLASNYRSTWPKAEVEGIRHHDTILADMRDHVEDSRDPGHVISTGIACTGRTFLVLPLKAVSYALRKTSRKRLRVFLKVLRAKLAVWLPNRGLASIQRCWCTPTEHRSSDRWMSKSQNTSRFRGCRAPITLTEDLKLHFRQWSQELGDGGPEQRNLPFVFGGSRMFNEEGTSLHQQPH